MANNRVYKTGEYSLKFPQKYKGSKPPVFKSSYEERMFFWCDTNTRILEWAYEPITILYRFEMPKNAPDVDKSVVDNKEHKYYPDVVAKLIDNDGKEVVCILEIKPYNQMVRPTEPKKKNKKTLNKYLNALQEYLKNDCKWKAARKFANEKNMLFYVLNERDLF